MTNVDKHGNITSPFREYDNNGRLAKSIETSGGSRDEFRYQYDAEGQVVRYEQYINAKPYSAYATEYDNKENPLSLMHPKLKGHPRFPCGQADYEFKNNIIKAVSYARDSASSEWKVNLSTLCTYVYNDKNLPTEVIGQSLDDKGILKDISRASYVYQDCQ
jgi:YD repeat-containing protein